MTFTDTHAFVRSNNTHTHTHTNTHTHTHHYTQTYNDNSNTARCIKSVHSEFIVLSVVWNWSIGLKFGKGRKSVNLVGVE